MFPIALVLLGRAVIGFIPAVIALTRWASHPIVDEHARGHARGRPRPHRGRARDGDDGPARSCGAWRCPSRCRSSWPAFGSRRCRSATATLASIVGGGTLGAFIVQGIDGGALDRVVGAALLVALLAIGTGLLFSLIERFLVSPGIRARTSQAREEAAQILRIRPCPRALIQADACRMR